jgi:phosphate acyltransferase
VFLGLNGVVIKSHGGTDAEGFAAAVDLGYDMARYELQAKIAQTLGKQKAGLGERPVAESIPS